MAKVILAGPYFGNNQTRSMGKKSDHLKTLYHENVFFMAHFN